MCPDQGAQSIEGEKKRISHFCKSAKHVHKGHLWTSFEWQIRKESKTKAKKKIMLFKSNKPYYAKIAWCFSFQERWTYKLNPYTFDCESSLKPLLPVRTKASSQASALSQTGSAKHTHGSSRRHLRLLVQREQMFWLQPCIKTRRISIFLWPVPS